jgi:hypothetical protein
MCIKDSPGAAIDQQILELSATIVGRTDRLASDVPHNNEQIETLQVQIARVTIIFGVVALIIAVRLFW